MTTPQGDPELDPFAEISMFFQGTEADEAEQEHNHHHEGHTVIGGDDCV